MIIVGYPIVFAPSTSIDLGGFIETIAPQAVDRALNSGDDIVALRSHDPNMPLGRRSTKSLFAFKDRRGLSVNIVADEDISYVADLARIMDREDAIGGSFGFRAIDDVWNFVDGMPHREVLDMQIHEVSVGVVFPVPGHGTQGATQ